MKPRERKHANYVCFHKLILATSNMAEGAKQYVHFHCWTGLSAHTRKKKTNYICIGEGNHARFELLSKIFESFNVMGCIPPPVCLWVCKESHNLCMNRASLDRQSLDRVS